MGTKKKDNTTYEFVCKAHDLMGESQDAQEYDYIQLLGLIRKYDMENRDAKLVAEIVYDYLEKNWRW